jgi:hypothetical protein
VGKGTLDSYPIGDTPYGKGGSRATAPTTNYRSLKRLEPLAITLLYPNGDPDRISWSELLNLGIGGRGYNGIYIHGTVLLV